jgi:hypothetical protein
MLRRTVVLIAIAAAGGCVGDVGGDDDGGPATLAFVTPAAGASFTRDSLDGVGALVASVGVELDVGGSPARVALSVDGSELGDADAAGLATVGIDRAGPATLVATAFDAGGGSLATAQVDIVVGDPMVADCHGWLDLYQIDYTTGPANPGVADPITATVPINGMPYRYVSNMDARPDLYADCQLILSLAEASAHFRRRDVVEVADIGIYNYRCIGGGTPPDCPQGISQHAYAKAIDIAGVTDGAGTFYSVNDDWVIDPDSEDTCDAPAEPGKDEFLHELICALKAAEVWNIVLTPNYNAAHRNHFHVDLTPGSDFIEKRAPVGH